MSERNRQEQIIHLGQLICANEQYIKKLESEEKCFSNDLLIASTRRHLDDLLGQLRALEDDIEWVPV